MTSTPTRHRSRAAAAAAASRACGHLAETDGRLDGDAWIPVVLLRADQRWMRERVAERGVAVQLPEEVPS